MNTIARKLRTILLAALSALSVAATPAFAADMLNGQGIFWRIDYGAAKPSYLLGTMHAADEVVLDMPKGAREAFEASDTVALELLIAGPHAEYRVATAITKGFFLTDQRTLDSLIGVQRFETLSAVLKERGIPPHFTRSINPWSAYLMTFRSQPRLDANGVEIETLDSRLEIDARAASIRLFALEAVKEQSELMASNDEMFETQLLIELIDAGEESGGLSQYLDAQRARRVEQYEAEDIGAMLTSRDKQFPIELRASYEKFLKRFIWKRNARMVQRMISLIVRGNSFIAVSAAHLPGEKGVVNMLVRRGYKVTRVQ